MSHREPRLPRALRALAATPAPFALLAMAACTSPEATRARGGGPGSDVGNRKPVVQIHAGANQYYDTPCLTEPVPCRGPLPVFDRISGRD